MDGYNDIQSLINTTPLMPMYNADGTHYFTQDDKQAEGWLLDNQAYNPLLIVAHETGSNRTRNYGLTAQAYVELQPMKGLKYHGSFSLRLTSDSFRQLISPYNGATNKTSDCYKVTQEQSTGHYTTLEHTLSYKLPDFGDHAFDVLIGQSYEKMAVGEYLHVENSVPDGSQLPTMQPDMDHGWIDNVSNQLGSTKLSGHPWPEWAILSYFGRLNYSYKERYMLTAIVRADGSSNFARGHRWGTFPSVSAGWTVSEEPFMKPTRGWLDLLKIRASWGQNGNQSIANFQYLSPVAFDGSHLYNFGETVTGTTGTKDVGAFAATLAGRGRDVGEIRTALASALTHGSSARA